MTKYTFILLVLFLINSNFLLSQNTYTVFLNDKLGKYDILHFVKETDSVVVIKKNSISNIDIENRIDDILKNKIGEKITKLKTGRKEYWFYFKLKSSYGLINSGTFSPNKNRHVIYTYKDFPILVYQKDLESLIIKR